MATLPLTIEHLIWGGGERFNVGKGTRYTGSSAYLIYRRSDKLYAVPVTIFAVTSDYIYTSSYTMDAPIVAMTSKYSIDTSSAITATYGDILPYKSNGYSYSSHGIGEYADDVTNYVLSICPSAWSSVINSYSSTNGLVQISIL